MSPDFAVEMAKFQFRLDPFRNSWRTQRSSGWLRALLWTLADVCSTDFGFISVPGFHPLEVFLAHGPHSFKIV